MKKEAHLLECNLQQITAKLSPLEQFRPYIGLSAIGRPIEDLIKIYEEGVDVDFQNLVKCYNGYQFENDVVKRLETLPKTTAHEEIVVPGTEGLIKGNPDYKYFGFPLDVKSVPLDEYIPHPTKIPSRAYWQIQAYMLYTNKQWGFLLYVSRASGNFKVIAVRENWAIHRKIEEKVSCLKQYLVESGKLAA